VDHGSILNKELNFIGGIDLGSKSKSSTQMNVSATKMDEADEMLFKYKANERELKRERLATAYKKER